MTGGFKRHIFALIFILGFSYHPVWCGDSPSRPVPLQFQSHGFAIDGLFFKAAGRGPFPTAILLHGYPDDPGDLLGLGSRMNENGINAFTFSYRGTWKSEGLFQPETSLEDVKRAVQFLKSPANVKRFAIDPANIFLVGHSYGGGFALLGSLSDSPVRGVVSIAGGDLSVVARMITESDEFRQRHQAMLDEAMSDPAKTRGLDGRASHEWLFKHEEDYNLVRFAEKLSKQSILLIGGWRDRAISLEDHILPLYRSLQQHGTKHLTIKMFDTDHSFENVRDRLQDLIVGFINAEKQ